MSVGKRIKERRKQLGMSAEELADRVGVSPATIYRYESGYIENVRASKLSPIAKALRTDEAFLMGWNEDVDSFQKDIQITLSESRLLTNYRQLNEEGQEKLLEYSEDLVASGRYIKSDEDELVEEET